MGKLPISHFGYITINFYCNRRMVSKFGNFVFDESKCFRCALNLSKLLSFIILIDLQKISELKQAIKTDPFSYGKYCVTSTIFSVAIEKWSAFMKSFGYFEILFSFASYIESMYN